MARYAVPIAQRNAGRRHFAHFDACGSEGKEHAGKMPALPVLGLSVGKPAFCGKRGQSGKGGVRRGVFILSGFDREGGGCQVAPVDRQVNPTGRGLTSDV